MVGIVVHLLVIVIDEHFFLAGISMLVETATISPGRQSQIFGIT